MSDKITLQAKSRSDVGKGSSRRLRRLADTVPGIVYGAKKEPTMITIEHRLVTKALENPAVYSSILTLNIDEKPEQVVLKDMQRHPYKPKVQHMDFQRIDANTVLHRNVPLKFIGEDIAPGVKLEGGIVSHLMTDIEVSCLPKDLPAFIAVDVSALHAGDTLHGSDLKLPAGVTLRTTEYDPAIVAISTKVAEEEPKEVISTEPTTPEAGAAGAAPEGK